MIPRTTQSMTSRLGILGKLNAYDSYNISEKGAVSSASKALVYFRAHQIVKDVNLNQHFTVMWNVKEESLASTIREAYQRRLDLLEF